jgi:hypothetical protein
MRDISRDLKGFDKEGTLVATTRVSKVRRSEIFGKYNFHEIRLLAEAFRHLLMLYSKLASLERSVIQFMKLFF